jgi:plasmid maintenance system killer protein
VGPFFGRRMAAGEGPIHLASVNEDGAAMSLADVTALIDDLYAREQLLLSSGLNSFTPLLRVIEDFSESPEELKEYRDFTIANNKSFIVKDPEFLAHWNRLKREAQDEHEATGKIWELELLNLRKRWRRREWEAGALETYRMLKPYKEERARLWAIEVERYATELPAEFEAKSKSRMGLYKAVMQQEQERTGVLLDRELSSTRAPIYSMAVGHDWKVCFRLDHVLLAKQFDGVMTDETTGERIRIGLQFDLWMQIWQRAEDGGEFRKIAPLSFQWLFPIGPTLFGPASYSKFTSLRELEALIRIHIQMFLFIREGLERTLLAGSA